MSRRPEVGSIVKFIGTDGKSAFTKIVDFQAKPDEHGFYRVHAVLELQGERKGFVGSVPSVNIKWNGKQFVADLSGSK